MWRDDTEHGSAVPVALAVTGAGVLFAVLVGGLAQGFGARARATSAADAAALAAAPVTFRPFGSGGDPAAEAQRFAAAHGAEVVACRCPVDGGYRRRRVEVTVAVSIEIFGLGGRQVEATSVAEFDPVALLVGN